MGLSSLRIVVTPIEKVAHAIEFLDRGGISILAECGILKEENVEVNIRWMARPSILLLLLLVCVLAPFLVIGSRGRLLSYVI